MVNQFLANNGEFYGKVIWLGSVIWKKTKKTRPIQRQRMNLGPLSANERT
jgi:hypothetical protein